MKNVNDDCALCGLDAMGNQCHLLSQSELSSHSNEAEYSVQLLTVSSERKCCSREAQMILYLRAPLLSLAARLLVNRAWRQATGLELNFWICDEDSRLFFDSHLACRSGARFIRILKTDKCIRLNSCMQRTSVHIKNI